MNPKNDQKLDKIWSPKMTTILCFCLTKVRSFWQWLNLFLSNLSGHFQTRLVSELRRDKYFQNLSWTTGRDGHLESLRSWCWPARGFYENVELWVKGDSDSCGHFLLDSKGPRLPAPDLPGCSSPFSATVVWDCRGRAIKLQVLAWSYWKEFVRKDGPYHQFIGG